MSSDPHDVAPQLPDRLNILKSPVSGDKEGYERLLSLLLELKAMMRQKISPATLREWEGRARLSLDSNEVDLLFARPDHDDFDMSALPGERYENLRRILLRRKGLSA
ncbi:hypothetical protein [Rhizobium halophilum]|uniref:hypothetical protein n=1 Tax=Rhizobium halophilum TaxID=2846852 RepID=UPI001EFCB361|nr:hypothetical protein [Rhizobium halophilum]MCF6370903.1 hypothetical protein [Rhizobium halophilum]